MTAQTAWLLAILAVVIAAAIGFFVGRRFTVGKERIAELESEVKRQQDQNEDYRKEVSAHFDKTATLFVSMAGSYKELFEHLSSGYEKLSSGAAREILEQRVDALLVGHGREAGDDDTLPTGAGLAAAAGVGTAGTAASADAVENQADSMPAPATPAEADEISRQVSAQTAEVPAEPSAPAPTDAVAEAAAETERALDAAAAPRTDEPRADEPRADEPRTDAPRTDKPRTDAARTDEPFRGEPALVGDPLAEEVIGRDPVPPRDTSR